VGAVYLAQPEVSTPWVSDPRLLSCPETVEGVVTIILGKVLRASHVQYHVFAHNHHYICTLRGKLLKGKAVTTNLLAVGDDVWITPTSETQAVIERVEKRRSKLSRRSPGREPREQLLAVNLDHAVIVMAAIAPDFNTNRLDRYIASCHSGGVRPVICINKIDLAIEEDIRRAMVTYESLGYAVLYTSAHTGRGLEELRELLKDSVSTLVGSSGVGKSSLINAIQPDLALKTKALREKFLKGQHTTTSAELLTLSMGGMVVDTPGMREFALWHDEHDEKGGVQASFPDIEQASYRCRFRNCTHTHEPACEVKRMVESGEIDYARHQSFLKLSR